MLVSVNLSGNALKTVIFIISGACLVAVKILILLSETGFKCMILRNLMRSETVIVTKPLNVKQDYFDVRRTFWVIQIENTLILSVLKIFSELLVMRGKSNLLLSASITPTSEFVVVEQLVWCREWSISVFLSKRSLCCLMAQWILVMISKE